jgi:outer membrane immunogenic protein
MTQWKNEPMNKVFQANVPVLVMMLAVSALPARAADTYERGIGGFKDELVAPFSNWDGFYLGGHLGYERGNVDYKVFDLFDSQTTRHGSFNADGVMGGGELGYNFQSGPWVYGVEADLGGMTLSGSRLDITPPLNNRYFSSSGGFYGDMTGRLGYALDRSLIYAKGGAAFADTEFKTLGPVVSGTRSDTLWGWTAGAGFEQRINADWSVKLEYLHFDFGSDSFDNVTKIPQDARRLTVSPTADAVITGVNYYVNRGYEPLK